MKYERGILGLIIPSDRVTEVVDNQVSGVVGNATKERRDCVKYQFITSNLEQFDKCVSKEHIVKGNNGRYVYLMDVNRYSKNIIVVEFFPGTAGQFLISCLNLSGNVSKYISKELKIDYIKQTLSNTTGGWVDPINATFDLEASETERMINNDEFIFIPTHHYEGSTGFISTPTKRIMSFFHNTKVIRFKNWIPLYFLRRFVTDVSLEQYLELSPKEKKELFSYIDIKQFVTNYDPNINSECFDKHRNLPPSDYTWDAMNFFSKELFLTGLKKLYDDIGLVDFDDELIGWYYDSWINRMAIWGKYK